MYIEASHKDQQAGSIPDNYVFTYPRPSTIRFKGTRHPDSLWQIDIVSSMCFNITLQKIACSLPGKPHQHRHAHGQRQCLND